MIANIEGREAIRLRADILWAARRWREAAEQIELLYGERWREFAPLADAERADMLRAAVGYALAEDTIGLAPVPRANTRPRWPRARTAAPSRW